MICELTQEPKFHNYLQINDNIKCVFFFWEIIKMIVDFVIDGILGLKS